ncbi:MAG: hypothetical protein P1V20_00125 [Verrucomicrobiales bacterium]|nr:hypothetical protein [Verrucomicrobiales bacterium]
MKINCPTCLEPLELPDQSAGGVEKCPTCNNQVPVPRSEKLSVTTSSTIRPAPVVRPNADRVSPEPRRQKPEVEKQVFHKEKKFSFRILAVVLLLLLFLAASLLFGTAAAAFYLVEFTDGPMVDFRDQFFKIIGITSQAEYTTRLAALTVGKALAPAMFAFFALVAVIRKKQITAIIMLTILVALGFLIGTPILEIICLILVCVPGRSDVWNRNSR